MVDSTNKLDTPFVLDASLDDIEDLPGFVTPPTGGYTLLVEEEPAQKEIGDKPFLEVKFVIKEVQEVQDMEENEVAPKEGDKFNYAFNLTDKIGIGKMKEFLSPFSERIGTRQLPELFAGMKGMEIVVVNKRTYDKVKDRHYVSPKKVSIV